MYPQAAKVWADLEARTSKANVNRVKREQAKVKKAVRIILAAGYAISVFDGEEWAVKRSKDRKAILDGLCNTDEDSIRIRNDTGDSIGFLFFVYGNDAEDLISDYSDNEETNRLVNLIEA